MSSGYLQKQIIRLIQQTRTNPPLDMALMGVSISHAVAIDGNMVVGEIINIYNGRALDFGRLRNVLPPIRGDNFFIEFSANCAFFPPNDTGWIGVHLVSYDIAKNSILFSEKLDPLPERLINCPEVYVLIIYRVFGKEMFTAPLGLVIGMDHEVGISIPGIFNFAAMTSLPIDYAQARNFTALVSYSIFQCFSLVDQGKLMLERVLASESKQLYRISKLSNHPIEADLS